MAHTWEAPSCGHATLGWVGEAWRQLRGGSCQQQLRTAGQRGQQHPGQAPVNLSPPHRENKAFSEHQELWGRRPSVCGLPGGLPRLGAGGRHADTGVGPSSGCGTGAWSPVLPVLNSDHFLLLPHFPAWPNTFLALSFSVAVTPRGFPELQTKWGPCGF